MIVFSGVTVIPTIKPAGPLTLTVDESLTLECIAEGDPDARVVWVPPHTSSVAEVEGRGSAIMRVRPVTEDEAGTFTCYIYSGVEEYEETIEIIGTHRHSHRRQTYGVLGPAA